jgi:hypothetical protein
VAASLEYSVKLADDCDRIENHCQNSNASHHIELFRGDGKSLVQICHDEISVAKPLERSSPAGGPDLGFDEINSEHPIEVWGTAPREGTICAADVEELASLRQQMKYGLTAM